MSYDIPVNSTVTGRYGDAPSGEDNVYTVEEFKDFCKDGWFIDFDDFGYPVKDSKANSGYVNKPSKLEKIPDDATHIVWYNR